MLGSLLSHKKKPRLSRVNDDIAAGVVAKQAETCVCELTLQRPTDEQTAGQIDTLGDDNASPHMTDRCAQFCKRRSDDKEQISQDLQGYTSISPSGFGKEIKL